MSNQKLNKQLRLETIRQAQEKSARTGAAINVKALAKRLKPASISVAKAEAKAKHAMEKRCKLGYKGNDLLERKRISTQHSSVGCNLGDFYRPDRRTHTVTARG